MNNLNQISPVPTETCTIQRLLKRTELPPQLDITPYQKVEDRYRVFINPSVGVSYFNLDHILDLDDYLTTKGHIPQIAVIKPPSRCKDGVNVYKGKFSQSIGILRDLHGKGFYQPQFQKQSYRGGRRFLFRSKELAQELYNSLSSTKLPLKIALGLVSVNQVFRFNSFSPEDKGFGEHFDLPYIDRSRSLMSRYTLLVYLTGGSGKTPKEPLQISEILSLENIGEFEFFIMDQKLLHSGYPYEQGPKLFMRTELIYNCNFQQDFKENAQVQQRFHTACYMAKCGITDESLQSYSKICFDWYARARLQIEKQLQTDMRLFILKTGKLWVNTQQYSEVQFMTDGYSYYFYDLSSNISYTIAVILADYFFVDRFQVLDKFHLPTSEGQHLKVVNQYLRKVESGEDKQSNESPKNIGVSINQPAQRTIFGFQDNCTRKYVEKIIEKCWLCRPQRDQYDDDEFEDDQQQIDEEENENTQQMISARKEKQQDQGGEQQQPEKDEGQKESSQEFSEKEEEDPFDIREVQTKLYLDGYQFDATDDMQMIEELLDAPKPKDSLHIVHNEYKQSFFRVNFEDLKIYYEERPAQLEYAKSDKFIIYFETSGRENNWAFASCQCVAEKLFLQTKMDHERYDLPYIRGQRTADGLLVLNISLFKNGYIQKHSKKDE